MSADEAIYVESDADPPSWLRVAIHELQELLELPEGWDSYGGAEVSTGAALNALAFLAEHMESNSPEPAYVPTPKGEVQLEWHLQGGDLEVKFGPEGFVEAFWATGNEECVLTKTQLAAQWADCLRRIRATR